MHLASSVSNTRLQDLSRASLLSKHHLLEKKWLNIYSSILFKVMMNHSCIKDQKFSTAGKTVLHLGSDYLSTNLPFGSRAYLETLTSFLISCLGRRITIQPQPQSWHLPLDYSLVLSVIRVEWVNNEKQSTLLFISNSIVLLVLTHQSVHQ